jgi:hypothetical protein
MYDYFSAAKNDLGCKKRERLKGCIVMKYKDLIEKVDKFEEEVELTECIYFGAIERLRDAQQDLGKLDDVRHVRRVIQPFLIQWGMMGRVVGREGLDWIELGETLRNLEK